MVPPRDLLKELATSTGFDEAERRRRADDFAAAKAKVQAVAAEIALRKGTNKSNAGPGSGIEKRDPRKVWRNIRQMANKINILMVGKRRRTVACRSRAYTYLPT